MNKEKSWFHNGKSCFIVILNASNYKIQQKKLMADETYSVLILIYSFLTSIYIILLRLGSNCCKIKVFKNSKTFLLIFSFNIV